MEVRDIIANQTAKKQNKSSLEIHIGKDTEAQANF